MTRKYWIIGFLFCVVSSCAINFSPTTWFKKKQKEILRVITVINDLNDLISAFSKETEELQKAISYTVEVNGIPIHPSDKKLISICNNQFTISLKSKKHLHEYFRKIPLRVKKLLAWATSWISVYNSFVCTIPEGTEVVNLGPLVLHVCQKTKARKSYGISYKKPFSIQVLLPETVKFY